MRLIGTAAALLLIATTAQATSVSYTGIELSEGTETIGFTDVTVAKPELLLTATATDGGVIRTYDVLGEQGLYIGAVRQGPFTTSNTTAPASGTYTLGFDKAVTEITFSLDYLTNLFGPSETISDFRVDGTLIDLTSANYTGTTTSLDDVTDVISTTVRRGTGVFTYSGGPFSSLSFVHEQNPRNIGFTITSLDVTLAPIPLPAGLPLLLAGLGGLALMARRKHS
ncbi:VPLPA-CTERM sorting domain-containing protein [Primorskyibacter sp. S187A]|uniref:VPLPA-CTERM sorting domain-containing protein n=1 Tax=Primorskyibacter sp. S187A TaxID=3415130 RepID=UPI003C7B0F2B